MTDAKPHEHKFRLNTDAFVNTKGPHGDFFMYCSGCDEHPTASDIEDAVNGIAASEAQVEALEMANEAWGSTMREIANSGVEFEDERVGYVAVQIDRDIWLDLAALRASEPPGEGKHD